MDERENQDGVPWWEVGGTTKRIAAYLWFNVRPGDTFTMAEVRRAAKIESQTQSDRRLRELREQGWEIIGYKDDTSLQMNTYRLEKRGQRLWLGEKLERDAISNKVRRQVFERDDNTCRICGIVAGEEYFDTPGVHARMTIGHRVPNQRRGEATIDNLQSECARCNETIRNLLDDPELLEDVMPAIELLTPAQLSQLCSWLDSGHREPSAVDIAYSRIRRLQKPEQLRARQVIHNILRNIENDRELFG